MGLYGYRDGYSVLGRIVCAIWYVGNGGVNLHGCKHMGRVLECRRSSYVSVWVRRGGMNLLCHGKLITVVRILNLHGCNKMGRVNGMARMVW